MIIDDVATQANSLLIHHPDAITDLMNIADGVVSSILSPIAVYNSISYSYGEEIGLMTVADIIVQVTEGSK